MDLGTAAASKTLSAPEMNPASRANLKGFMNTLARVLKTVGDTFVKMYMTSLMISIFPGNPSNSNNRYR
jgi:hypothetical protein